jgi:hypothetical protein
LNHNLLAGFCLAPYRHDHIALQNGMVGKQAAKSQWLGGRKR